MPSLISHRFRFKELLILLRRSAFLEGIALVIYLVLHAAFLMMASESAGIVT